MFQVFHDVPWLLFQFCVFFLIRSCPLILAVECNRDWEEGFALSYSLHILLMLDLTLIVLHFIYILIKTRSIVYKHCPRNPIVSYSLPLGLPKNTRFSVPSEIRNLLANRRSQFPLEVRRTYNAGASMVTMKHIKPGCWESQLTIRWFEAF